MSEKSILLIEDDIATQRAYKAVCKGDYAIHIGSSIKEAQKILETHNIDLLLLDHQLPDGTGFDCIKTVNQQGFTKPIVVITAYPSSEIVDQYLKKEKVNQLLVKPVDPSLLQFTIKHILDPDYDYMRELYNYQKMVITADFALPLVHEINSYLTTIIGYLNIWGTRFRRKDEEDVRLIQKALSSAKTISNLTNQFMTATRPYKLVWSKTNVNEVIRSAFDLAYARMKIPCECKIQLCPKLPQCETVSDLLLQALLNLILNSLEAMQLTGGTLTITSNFVSNSYLSIMISDTGEGISNENFPKVFDPFFTTKRNGVGLGLYVVKRIIDQLGGELRFESEHFVGTTAIIFLPLFHNLVY